MCHYVCLRSEPRPYVVERAAAGHLLCRSHRRSRDAGGCVRLVLVERLVLEQRAGERVELAAVLASAARTTSLVRLVDDPPHLVVDQLLRVRRDLGDTRGAAARAPSRAITASGPIASLMPQRPTIWRAISVSCWMSDSAPVLMSPNTTSSAARPPSATLIFAQQLRLAVVEAVGVGRREGHAERQPARDDRDLAHRVGALGEHADDRVAGLVVGGAAAVLLAHHHLALGAEHDPLERVGEVRLLDLLVARGVPPAAPPR